MEITKALKGMALAIAATVILMVNSGLNLIAANILSIVAYIIFVYGIYLVAKAHTGDLQKKLMLFVYGCLIAIVPSALFGYIGNLIFQLASHGLIIAALYFWRKNAETPTKARTGINLLFVSEIILVILAFFHTNSNLMQSYLVGDIFAPFKALAGLFALIGYCYTYSAYIPEGEGKEIKLKMLHAMIGSGMAISVVMGEGFISELISFIGLIILYLAVKKIRSLSAEAFESKRLEIGTIIAMVAMFINMIPLLEFIGTFIELPAYIIMASGFFKLDRCEAFNSTKHFKHAGIAMVLMVVATLIHAIPFFGIGVSIAAVIGAFTIIGIVIAWQKATDSIKSLSGEQNTLEGKDVKQLAS